jgi:segregation and condensation protein B
MDLTAVIEALLIASEEPLPTPEIARVIRARVAELQDQVVDDEEDYEVPPELEEALKGLSTYAQVGEEEVLVAIVELNQAYEETGRAFLLLERTKGWKIYTRPEFAGVVQQLFPGKKPKRLSGPAMETLAIIAYRQPVTKAAMEAVRGVSCDGMLQKLLDLELIRIEGRADLPGRPLLYSTTEYFFEHFGIKSVDELPNAAELRHVPLPEPEPEEVAEESSDEQLTLETPSEEPPAAAEDPGQDYAIIEEESTEEESTEEESIEEEPTEEETPSDEKEESPTEEQDEPAEEEAEATHS